MTKFRRSGHWRTNSYGTTFYVSPHDVSRDDWGGQGYLPAPSPVELAPLFGMWPRSFEATLESFTVPNAKCPVCGEAVFFYRSPHGGSVFFDELGPPWPKHRCTDDGSTPRAPPVESSDAVDKHDAWAAEGWRPFVVSHHVKGEIATYLTGRDTRSGETLHLAVDGTPTLTAPSSTANSTALRNGRRSSGYGIRLGTRMELPGKRRTPGSVLRTTRS